MRTAGFELRGPTTRVRDLIREVIGARDVVSMLARKDFFVRYRRASLGVLWAIGLPVIQAAVLSVVFTRVIKIDVGVSYVVFVLAGVLPWTYFSSTLLSGSTSIVDGSALASKIYFPRATLLVAGLIASSLDLLVSASLFLGMMVYYKVSITLSALWVLPLLGVQMLFALGVVGLTSAAHVNFRDVGHGLPLMLQLWMFASPVAYPLSVIPDWLLPFYLLNPMAAIIDGYRRALLHGTGPDLLAVGVSAACVTLFAILSLSVFKRAERTFADVI